MFLDVHMFYIKAITPVHAGSGRELGLIDMPIQKEQHTGIPKIEGSTVKGCLREVHRCGKQKGDINTLFGPEKGDAQAGLLGFSDAKLLLYPFISVGHVFAYATCPYLINRYMDDCRLIDNTGRCSEEENNNTILEKHISMEDGHFIPIINMDDAKGHIILNEYRFIKADNCGINVKEKLNNMNLTKPVVMISDVDFIEMITLCKEIITRNRINHETGTVDKKEGGLFTEEYLPAESILYSLLLRNGIKSDEVNYSNYWDDFPRYAQFGGNATVGKGLVQLYK